MSNLLWELLFPKKCPWWKFWNPSSGFLGGAILGVLLNICGALLMSVLR